VPIKFSLMSSDYFDDPDEDLELERPDPVVRDRGREEPVLPVESAWFEVYGVMDEATLSRLMAKVLSTEDAEAGGNEHPAVYVRPVADPEGRTPPGATEGWYDLRAEIRGKRPE
jgi:hypothetical protein